MADFFVDMGQISPRRRQLLTKQWSGNKCSDAPTQIQTSSYAMDHRDLSGKQWRAEHQACYCTRLTAHFSQTVKPFEGLLLLYFVFKMHPFFFKIVHYYVVIFSQNCCFVTNFVDKTIVDDSAMKYSNSCLKWSWVNAKLVSLQKGIASIQRWNLLPAPCPLRIWASLPSPPSLSGKEPPYLMCRTWIPRPIWRWWEGPSCLA